MAVYRGEGIRRCLLRPVCLLTVLLIVLLIVLLDTAPLPAEMPYTGQTQVLDPYDYRSYLLLDGDHQLPATFDLEETWWLTDSRDHDPLLAYSPQELYGVRGMGVNKAWQISTGRPDVTIAILDSGIRWNGERCELLRKYYLNRGELPMPEGGPNPDDTRFGGYDVNGDGVFNVVDYWNDSRVVSLNGNDWIDPEDLILTFSDGVDDDGNGYPDDISGWDFFEQDNDPQDDVEHGHGSNQADHATAEAILAGETCPGQADAPFAAIPGTCPSCMVIPLRVADSFIADANHFAEAVVYAVDNRVQVVETALGTLNHTSFGQRAVDYAYRNGVIVNASEADEAAGHHNWPAAYEHTVVHNSVRPPVVPGTYPKSYLLVNGCTNFGAYTHISIPSSGCSSQATGLAAGVSGLLVSAALNAVENGAMTSYVADDGSLAASALSAEELAQLWRLAGDDIDFSTDYPDHAFSSLWPEYRPAIWSGPPPSEPDSYDMTALLVPTERYQTVRGWDYFTGYGRLNAARLLRFIGLEPTTGESRELVPGGGPYSVGHDDSLSAQDRIPPEADLVWPRRWHQYAWTGPHHLLLADDPARPDQIVVRGRVAANRVTRAGGSFDYVLEWAPGAQGPPSSAGLSLAAADSEETSLGPWTEVARVSGLTNAYRGELGRIAVADVADAISSAPYAFALRGDPSGPRETERWAVRLRLRVLAHPVKPHDLVNNEAVQQKQIDVYPAAELVLRDDLGRDGMSTGGCGSPSFADVDGDGRDELLVPTDDGLVHAYTDLESGQELAGWPVSTRTLPGLPELGDNAFTRGDLSNQVTSGLLFGTVAVADLDDDGSAEVLAGDTDGRLYAWQADGSLRPGFPVTVDYSLSRELPCTAGTVPACDDFGATDLRSPANRRDWAFHAAPAVGELDPGSPGLEIVAGAADSHLYAWHADGSPVAGWPVVLRDPDKVAAMDPATRFFTYTPDSAWLPGSKVTNTPSLCDINNDGLLEVVATVNEEYAEVPNAWVQDTFIELGLLLAAQSGNGRIYALHRSGAQTAASSAAAASAHTQDQAYLDGWPVPIAITKTDLLPTAAQGSNSQPPIADIDGDGTMEIVAASHFGGGYVLDHDGGSFLGLERGVYRTWRREGGDFGARSLATDDPSLPTLGGIALGSMTGDGRLTIATGCAGIGRMLDNALAGRQYRGEDHLGLWRAVDGQYEENAPLQVNDLQFFTTPIFGDTDGDGLAEVIQQSSFSDIVVAGLDDDDTSATVYHTGGWQMSSPAIGIPPLGNRRPTTLGLASISREGYLRLLPTTTPAHGAAAARALAEWPELGHDHHNSGCYHTDAVRPSPVRDLQATEIAAPDNGNPGAVAALLRFLAPGDDREAGRVDHYQVRLLAGAVAEPRWTEATAAELVATSPAAAGRPDSLQVTGLAAGQVYTFVVRAYDEAGNGSAPAVVHLATSGGRRRPGGRRSLPGGLRSGLLPSP